MKIRQGFVSNSSTTSFCIYGVSMTEEEFEAANATRREFTSKTGLEYYRDEEDFIYIGRSWSSIGDDETGRNFKESVQSKVSEFFPEKNEFSTIESAYYNG